MCFQPLSKRPFDTFSSLFLVLQTRERQASPAPTCSLTWLQFLERLLHSPHRTTDPESADFFFVPAWPRWRLIRGVYTQRVVDYISATWPYWKRHGGADHLFVMTDDWGPCDEGG